MFAERWSSRLQGALKRGVARGILPFDWGAARSHRTFVATSPEESPLTFSEKVRYKLRHDRRAILKTYADKLAVRDYVRTTCSDVRLPRLLGVHATAESAVAGIPREPWVMKASHGSSMVLVSAANRPSAAEVRRCARQWLRVDYGLHYWEWQYFKLPRRILFEEYLGNENGVPPDYKFYVIHQRVRFIEVDQNRFTGHTRDFFYPDWTPIDSRIGPAPVACRRPPPPPQLERMIAIAETLSCNTDFLRVDLYAVRDEVFFGELTHTPAAGNFNFADRALDEKLGHDWRLPRHFR